MEDFDPLGISQLRRLRAFGWTNFLHESISVRRVGVSDVRISTASTLVGSGALLLFAPVLLPRRGGAVLLLGLGCIGFATWNYFSQFSGLGGIWIGGFGLAGFTASAIGIIMLTHKDPAATQHSAQLRQASSIKDAGRPQHSRQLRQAGDTSAQATKTTATINQSPAENLPAKCIATLGSRVGAYTIDILLILILVLSVTWVPFGFGEALAERFHNLNDVDSHVKFLVARNRVRDLSFLIYIVYCTFLEASPLQGTLGKRSVCIRVCDIQGRRITLIRSLIRNLSKILSYATLGIGLLIALGSERRQTLHDQIAGTVVIEDDPSPNRDT